MRVVVSATHDEEVRIRRGKAQSVDDRFFNQPGLDMDRREFILQMGESVEQLLLLVFADLSQLPQNRITRTAAKGPIRADSD
jgi:hypothetical protein